MFVAAPHVMVSKLASCPQKELGARTKQCCGIGHRSPFGTQTRSLRSRKALETLWSPSRPRNLL